MKKIVSMVALLGSFGSIWAGATTVPNTFTNGQVADANQVNENFSYMANLINGLQGGVDTVVNVSLTNLETSVADLGANVVGLQGDVQTVNTNLTNLQTQMVDFVQTSSLIYPQIATADTLLSGNSRVVAMNDPYVELTLPEPNTVPGRLYDIQTVMANTVVDLALASGNIDEPFSTYRLQNGGKMEVLSDGNKWHLLMGGAGKKLLQELKGFGIFADIYPGTYSSNPGYFFPFGSQVLFVAQDGINGQELWVSDGTVAGTSLVKDINPGYSPSNPANFIEFQGQVYFSADDGTNGYELWKTDGTEAGTQLVADIFPGIDSSEPYDFATTATQIFFTASDGTNGRELWVSDGTAGGTQILKDINTTPFTGSLINGVTALGAGIIFQATEDAYGAELWYSDGTTAGTNLLKDIYPGSFGSNPGQFVVVGSEAVFVATDDVNGTEIWKTNGTEVGTELLLDLNPGLSGSDPNSLAETDGVIYFSADSDGNGSDEIFVSNGTSGGTGLLIAPGGYLYIQSLIKSGSKYIYFHDSDGIGELYSTDGTPEGTNLILGDFYINSTTDSQGKSFSFLPYHGKVIFSGRKGYYGSDGLYMTDGTAEGTHTLIDGANESGTDVYNWWVNGDYFYLNMTQGYPSVYGYEPYIMGGDVPPVPPVVTPTMINP